jgi:hypothetical protein
MRLMAPEIGLNKRVGGETGIFGRMGQARVAGSIGIRAIENANEELLERVDKAIQAPEIDCLGPPSSASIDQPIARWGGIESIISFGAVDRTGEGNFSHAAFHQRYFASSRVLSETFENQIGGQVRAPKSSQVLLEDLAVKRRFSLAELYAVH